MRWLKELGSFCGSSIKYRQCFEAITRSDGKYCLHWNHSVPHAGYCELLLFQVPLRTMQLCSTAFKKGIVFQRYSGRYPQPAFASPWKSWWNGLKSSDFNTSAKTVQTVHWVIWSSYLRRCTTLLPSSIFSICRHSCSSQRSPKVGRTTIYADHC